MYRNSPPELRESVLVTFRAALLSAVKTVSEILAPGEPVVPLTPTTRPSAGDQQDNEQRIGAMISLIEGAIVMYKNSPPELHSSILVTLRAALLSGIGALNGIIANNQIPNLQFYQAAQPSEEPKAVPGKVNDVVPQLGGVAAVVAAEPAKAVAASGHSGKDENSKFFEQLHAKLETAKGEGKMGLRTDMSSVTATELANDLAKMRSLLVKELQDGIPKSKATDVESTSSSTGNSGPSTSLRYQEMLAKARAENAS